MGLSQELDDVSSGSERDTDDDSGLYRPARREHKGIAFVFGGPDDVEAGVSVSPELKDVALLIDSELRHGGYLM